MWGQLSLFLKKLKNRFSKIPLKWNCSNQQINTKSFHYIYRWTYHENLIALVQKTIEVYYYPLRPLKWAKTQKLAPTGHFKGYDPTFWAKRHTMTLDMIPKGWIQDQIPTQKAPCLTHGMPLKNIIHLVSTFVTIQVGNKSIKKHAI